MSKRTSEDMVKEFHLALDHPVAERPTQVPEDRRRLRMRLIAEETTELLCALVGFDKNETKAEVQRMVDRVDDLIWLSGGRQANLTEVADGCCDSHYVISGTAIEYGIPEDVVYTAVHKANMAKAGGPVDEFGKTQRPEGWTAAPVAEILEAASAGEYDLTGAQGRVEEHEAQAQWGNGA